ncbi:MAG: DUF1700 domain-containing protein [Clostridia bacterium]|nr:DUF1700 domain-containing protein [Clostridia bacterium]
MNKQAFAEELRRCLADLPGEDAERSVEFYVEMIEDRMEEGLSEEEAVSAVGTPLEVSFRIRSELSIAEEKPAASEAPKEKKSPWMLVLLILGFPVWGALLIGAVAVAFSLLAAAISLLVSLWAVFVALGGAALLWGISAAVSVGAGSLPAAGMLFGLGLFCAGLCIFGFFGCRYVTKISLEGLKKLWCRIKERSQRA